MSETKNNTPTPRKYTDVMFDIETVGNKADAPILSIAAVPFNPQTGEVCPKESCFHIFINQKDIFSQGSKADGSTFLWWLEQSEEARMALVNGQKNSDNLRFVLTKLSSFVFDHIGADGRVWGNGASFDITILTEAYERILGYGIPWQYNNVRCYRTLKSITPKTLRVEPEVAHDALEDAYAQAKSCVNMLQYLQLTQDAANFTKVTTLIPSENPTETPAEK